MEKKELFGENTGENIYHCIKCGLCMAHCPVYKEVLLEEATPRGKVQLSRCLSEGNLELSEEVKDAFFSTCLLCGSCVANCPSGVHGDHLFSGVRWRAKQKLRHRLEEEDDVPAPGQQMEDVDVGLVRQWARKMFGGPWIESKLNAGALDRGADSAHERPALFRRRSRRSSSPRERPRAKVLYFHGCATNYLYGANRPRRRGCPGEDGRGGDHPQGADLLRPSHLHVGRPGNLPPDASGTP